MYLTGTDLREHRLSKAPATGVVSILDRQFADCYLEKWITLKPPPLSQWHFGLLIMIHSDFLYRVYKRNTPVSGDAKSYHPLMRAREY